MAPLSLLSYQVLIIMITLKQGEQMDLYLSREKGGCPKTMAVYWPIRRTQAGGMPWSGIAPARGKAFLSYYCIPVTKAAFCVNPRTERRIAPRKNKNQATIPSAEIGVL
jgi:hypothetical protein